MSITSDAELSGIKKISNAVALTLKEMREFTKTGLTARELDEYGGSILAKVGAASAPKLTYGFPGFTCISVNNEVAHGIP
jgi:methionyl aminopeptidase